VVFPDVPLQSVAGHLLVMLRISAWIAIAPPFNHKAIPMRVKALLAFAITLAVGATQDFSHLSLQDADLFLAALQQVFMGLALGFGCYLVFAAVETAGNHIDLFGGFQLSQAYDPQMQSGAAVFGRLYQMTTLVLLFASDAYLVLLRGITSTFDVVGVSGVLSLKATASTLTDALGHLFVASVQIAGPLIAILFLTDVGLGLLTRAAPALQAFQLGFPLKIFVTLSVAAIALAVLPSVVDASTGSATTQTAQLAQASTGAAGSAAP
jgi:flagellar biosynthetic protein FliR